MRHTRRFSFPSPPAIIAREVTKRCVRGSMHEGGWNNFRREEFKYSTLGRFLKSNEKGGGRILSSRIWNFVRDALSFFPSLLILSRPRFTEMAGSFEDELERERNSQR